MDEDILTNEELEFLYLHKHRFSIVANTISGAKFYSQEYPSYDSAKIDFYIYRELVNYLGGGDCTMYEFDVFGDKQIVRFDLV